MDIQITLLLTKRSNVKMNELDVSVVTERNGYAVVAGENNATKITVNYPEPYNRTNRYVTMMNANAEYANIVFAKETGSVSFNLPASMTFVGNTELIFYSDNEMEGENKIVTVWLPIIVPIIETGVDYKQVAMASPEILQEAISKSNSAVSTANTANSTANSANAKATTAETNSSNAVTTANSANTKSDTAITTANSANSVANGIDSKASMALTQSGQAVETANVSKATADNSVNVSTQAKNISIAADNAVNNIRSPITGLLGTAQTAIDDIFNSLTYGVTANEYDRLGLTATAYDSKAITALDFDKKSRFILVGQ